MLYDSRGQFGDTLDVAFRLLDGIDPSAFAPVVSVRVGGVWQRGWLHVPGEPAVWQLSIGRLRLDRPTG